ncbi:MSMEG_0565 family glycosyltransferase [Synechococcus sp. PCC 7336]|uniref:MSMEG_0565 family glycosyltransferase n=1 Tax=Synechococcus sp. PCC 7336 TaxID=195250 RepID=UPI00034DDF82|nr:MSMEG_0565 family glycosyltransferase [Synechococcus sp. PCC 7336]
MTPLRIALLTYSTQPRGGVIHAMELAEALYTLGHSVCLFALDKTGAGFPRPLNCEAVCVPAAPAPSDIGELVQWRIREYVDYFTKCDRPFDCYHAQDCLSANALVALRDRQIVPHVIRTVHHIDEFNSSYLRTCQDRSILEVDRCFCVSEYWQQQLRVHYGVEALQVANGVNLKRYSPQPSGRESALKQRLGMSQSPIFLTVGGIEPRKNSIRLLQAFARVLQQHPQAQLAIAGGATLFDYEAYRQEFFAEVERLKISVGQSLLLPGPIADADMADLYRCADVFVFPSLKEGWGLVALEAIASGLPAVTSNRPPFTEFLDRDRALLVDPESPEAIAEGMCRALDATVCQSLIQHSQAVVRHYSWATSAQLHLRHYRQVLSEFAKGVSHARNAI